MIATTPSNANTQELLKGYPSIELVMDYKSSYDIFKSYLGFVNNSSIENNVMKNKIELDFKTDLQSKRMFYKNSQMIKLNKCFEETFQKLIFLSPTFIGVELTRNNSIFFFVKYSNLNIHFEVLIDEKDKTEKVALNIFNEKSHILSQLLEINEALTFIKNEYINNYSEESYLDLGLGNIYNNDIPERTLAESSEIAYCM